MSRGIYPDNFLREQTKQGEDQQRTKLALQRIESPQIFLDTQVVEGGGSGSLKPIPPGSSWVIADDALTPMTLRYSPLLDSWWEVSCCVGDVRRAAMHSGTLLLTLSLSPAPTAGASTVQRTIMASEGTGSASLTHIFKISGGTSYVCSMTWSSGSGFSYSNTSSVLWMHGKGWSR